MILHHTHTHTQAKANLRSVENWIVHPIKNAVKEIFLAFCKPFLALIMVLGFMSYSPFLNAQPSTNCPEYSICLETNPLDCNVISVSINGLVGDSIAGITFEIEVPDGLIIDINETKSSFQNTSVGTHFGAAFGNILQVDSESVRVSYPAVGSVSAYVPTEECVHIGNIIFEPVEVDCIDFDSLDFQFTPLFNGPIYIGSDFQNSTPCSNYELDCPCTGDCPIDDWRFCFSQDGCGKVNVHLIGLEGVSNVSGIRFSFVFDPELEIDEQLTQTSIENSSFLGGNNWEEGDLNISTNTISFFYRNENGSGTNTGFQTQFELFFDIFFKPQAGVCYDFGSDGVNFGAQSGLFIGDHLTDPDVVFCDNYTNNCLGEVCSDGVTLSGNILRPTNAGSCDEAIDFGFPYGKVNITTTYCGYDYEFEVLTDDAGYYDLEVFPDNQYTIIPAYTEEHQYACGVNSIDVDIIRALILGQTTCFPYPFSNIAADMDLNSWIATFDLALLERYILEIQYPEAGKWRFLPASQYQTYFDGVSCPGFGVPSYDTTLIANVLTSNYTNANFRAIKMGDVDGSCEQCLESDSLIQNPPTLMVSSTYNTEAKTLDVYYNDMILRDITVINLAVDAGQGVTMKEIDFMKVLSPDELIFRGSDNSIGNYGWVSLKQKGNTLDFGDRIASFEVDEFIDPASLQLKLGEIVVDGKLYHLELDDNGVDIAESIREASGKTEIKLVPNPGRDNFQIKIPSDYSGPYKIRIMDMMGRDHGYYSTELRQFTVTDPGLPSGTYPVLITGPNFSKSVMWVKID